MITLGCRLNAAESEAMRLLAQSEDDLVIVNSCAVTNEAVRRTRQAIRRAKKDRPGARIVVTGCAAQVEPETFAAMPEVDRVIGNSEKFSLLSFTPPHRKLGSMPGSGENAEPAWMPAFAGMTEEKVRVSDIFASREASPQLLPAFAERSRAFVEVQNGCDHRCTFCIIPYGRGNSRSVPAGLVVDEVKALAGKGVSEVVLTGVDVTSYGPDLPGASSLGLLVERILRLVPELQRLRLSSLDCIEIDSRLEELIAGEPRFMPHLHMSFQAGDDMVLKRMKRRHSRAQAVEAVARLKSRRPGLAIGADLIAGFPTETEAMHENSLRLIDECDIVMGHIFPFSPKAGTPAARMPPVPAPVVRERARRLREACARRTAAWLQGMVGTRQRVLMERGGLGHAENFAPVRLSEGEGGSTRHPRESGGPAFSFASSVGEKKRDSRFRGNDGKLVEALITGVEAGTLVGVPA
jgi:threonylcarbamoyladenosine tRNA methylthiotransferase MtaB